MSKHVTPKSCASRSKWTGPVNEESINQILRSPWNEPDISRLEQNRSATIDAEWPDNVLTGRDDEAVISHKLINSSSPAINIRKKRRFIFLT